MEFRSIGILIGIFLWSLSGVAVSQEGGSTCATYSFNQPVSAAGDTNGAFPDLQPGDQFTFTMTPGTATTASWRIVSNPSGDSGSTLVGGGTVSSTLQYTYSSPSPGAAPVGFYVDSIDGTATIRASCSPGRSTSIPTLSEWGLLMLALLMGVYGVLQIRRIS